MTTTRFVKNPQEDCEFYNETIFDITLNKKPHIKEIKKKRNIKLKKIGVQIHEVGSQPDIVHEIVLLQGFLVETPPFFYPLKSTTSNLALPS